MKIKLLSFCILLGFISPLTASSLKEIEQDYTKIIQTLSYQIQEITKTEVSYVKQQSFLHKESIQDRLKPIVKGIQELGPETDPSVKIIMQAYKLFECSLKAYYQMTPTDFSPKLVDVYRRITTENFGKDIEYMANYLKIVTQMVFYEKPEDYAKYFTINIAKNHAVFFTLCKERLMHFYPEYFTWQMVANDDHNVVKYLRTLYKTHKSYGREMQGYLAESWQAHRQALPKICPNHIGVLISSIKKTDESFQTESLTGKMWQRNLITKDIKTKIQTFLVHPPHYFIIDEAPRDLWGKVKMLTLVNEPIQKETSISPGEAPKPSIMPAKELEGEKPSLTNTISSQEAPTLLEAESIMNSLEFYTQLQAAPKPEPMPSSSSNKASKTFPSSKKQSKKVKVSPQVMQKETLNKSLQTLPEKISFTLAHTMSEGAITDFLTALKILSEETKNNLNNKIKEDINALKDRKISLKKSYKIMLRLVNQLRQLGLAKLEIDRGKGSHAMITGFRNGKPKK